MDFTGIPDVREIGVKDKKNKFLTLTPIFAVVIMTKRDAEVAQR
ncbi:hypothetical protein TPY_3550 [Sulfobacillus acidophilus TPY]|nr:hypothetical protein TPY_3550 [Sulfobacillus acidophilus TPY]